jgi:phage tail tape-measure protein
MSIMRSFKGCVRISKRQKTCPPCAPLVKSPESRKQATLQGGFMKRSLTATIALALLVTLAGCSQPLSTREKATGVGALGGAAAGGIIGATVGAPGVGAAVGGALGAGAGFLIGDQMQRNDQIRADQQRQIDRNRADQERLRQQQQQPPPPREY